MVKGLLLISNHASFFFHSLLELVTTEGNKDNHYYTEDPFHKIRD